MDLHFSFLWFGQILGPFLSLETSPEFSAVVLTLDGVCTFHPRVIFMFLPDLFWHEVTLLDSDILIAKMYCLYCSCNNMSILHTKKPQPPNHHAQKAGDTCFILGCLYFQTYLFHFMILRKRAFFLFIDYKTLLAPAKLTLLIAVKWNCCYHLFIKPVRASRETRRENCERSKLLRNPWQCVIPVNW